MGYKIFVTPRSFGKINPKPYEMLEAEGYKIIKNPYDRVLTEEEMIHEIKDIDGIIVGIDPLNSRVLKHAKKLKVISKYGVGTDNIDLDYANKAGIIVTRTVGANSEAVADYAIALMLGVARRIVFVDKKCRNLNWNSEVSLDVWGKTLGIIGLGKIGKGVAKRALGFNMKIFVYDSYIDEEFAIHNNLEYAPLDKLLKESDFISLHAPLTADTMNMISFEQFEMMKKTAVILNTARGGIINEDALLKALNEKRIWGAGIDVFEEEPPKRREFFELDNLIIGSHCASSTFDAINNMGVMAVQSIILNMPNTKNSRPQMTAKGEYALNG